MMQLSANNRVHVNVFTSFIALTAFVACDRPSDEAVEEAAQIDRVPREFDIIDETEPPRDYGDAGACFGSSPGGRSDRDDDGGMPKAKGHCLAKCVDDDSPTVLTDKMVETEDKANWCEYQAKEFCRQIGKDFDKWCWGRVAS